MAKTMIEKIRETETVAQEKITDAQYLVKEKIKEATTAAEEALKNSMAQADRDGAEIIEKAQAQARDEKHTAERRGWAEGEKLSAKADKNREKAVNAAIEIIFS